MNRIDVSAIQPHPSKLTSPNLDTSQPNSTPSDRSFAVQQLKRHAIFRTEQVKGELGGMRGKISFKVPPIEDYYIRQSRENINPSKLHRMESMIETQHREERVVEPPPPLSLVKAKSSRSVSKLWIGIVAVIVAGLTAWAYRQLGE